MAIPKNIHPWYINIGSSTVSIVDKELNTIALLPEKSEKTLEIALVLAAAPDLYTALRQVRTWLLHLNVQDDILIVVRNALSLLEDDSAVRALKLQSDPIWDSIDKTIQGLPE